MARPWFLDAEVARILEERGVKPAMYELWVKRDLQRKTDLAMTGVVATISTLLVTASLASLADQPGRSVPELLGVAAVLFSFPVVLALGVFHLRQRQRPLAGAMLTLGAVHYRTATYLRKLSAKRWREIAATEPTPAELAPAPVARKVKEFKPPVGLVRARRVTGWATAISIPVFFVLANLVAERNFGIATATILVPFGAWLVARGVLDRARLRHDISEGEAPGLTVRTFFLMRLVYGVALVLLGLCIGFSEPMALP